MGLNGIIFLAVNIMFFFGAYLYKNVSEWKRYIRHWVAGFLVQGAVLAAVCFGPKIFMDTEKQIPWIATLVFCVCVSFGFLFLKTKTKGAKFSRISACAAIVLILAECFVFNMSSYTDKFLRQDVALSFAKFESATVKEKENSIVVEKDGSFCIENVAYKDASYVFLHTQGQPPRQAVEVQIRDHNFSEVYITANLKSFSPQSKEIGFYIRPYEELNAMRFSFTNVKQPFAITGITLTNAAPFDFMPIRFLGLLAIVLTCAAVGVFGLWKIRYNPKSKKQGIAVAAMIGLCVLLSVQIFSLAPQKTVPYQKGQDITYSDILVKQFDAFQKGQTHLDVKPDEKLKYLDNVYDSSQRREENVPYQWDTAYYDGQYYCYFGVAPIFTVYYPFYMLTGQLPSMATTVFIFSLASICSLCFLALRLIKRYAKKANFLLVLCLLPALVLLSNVYLLENLTNVYSALALAALFFVSFGLWMGFLGVDLQNKKLSYLAFFLSGVSFVLVVASRVTSAFWLLVLIPSFIALLLNKGRKISNKLISVGCFCLPILVGAFLIMWYNMARFGAPFEFGAAYQLTVNDVHANRLNLHLLPATLYYFFQLPSFIPSFPYIRSSFTSTAAFGGYMYSDGGMFGAMVYPVISVGSVVALDSLRRIFKRDKVKCFTILLVALVSVWIAFCNLCMGGIIMRYLIDFMPILAIFSAVALLIWYNRSPNAKRFWVNILIIAITCVFCALLFLDFFDITLWGQNFPEFFQRLEEMFVFWK